MLLLLKLMLLLLQQMKAACCSQEVQGAVNSPAKQLVVWDVLCLLVLCSWFQGVDAMPPQRPMRGKWNFVEKDYSAAALQAAEDAEEAQSCSNPSSRGATGKYVSLLDISNNPSLRDQLECSLPEVWHTDVGSEDHLTSAGSEQHGCDATAGELVPRFKMPRAPGSSVGSMSKLSTTSSFKRQRLPGSSLQPLQQQCPSIPATVVSTTASSTASAFKKQRLPGSTCSSHALPSHNNMPPPPSHNPPSTVRTKSDSSTQPTEGTLPRMACVDFNKYFPVGSEDEWDSEHGSLEDKEVIDLPDMEGGGSINSDVSGGYCCCNSCSCC